MTCAQTIMLFRRQQSDARVFGARSLLLTFLLALVIGAVAIFSGGCGGGTKAANGAPPAPAPPAPGPPPPPAPSLTPGFVKNLIVVVFQNRSFDHLFGVFPAPAGQTVEGIHEGVAGFSQADQAGNIITPHLLPATFSRDLSHTHASYLRSWNNGLMDKFAFYIGDQSLGHYDNSTPGMQKLWVLAQQYALADNYFNSVLSTAPASPLYMVAASDNEQPNSVQPAFGCRQPGPVAPPYDFPNVGDQLTAAHIGWAWFQENLQQCGNEFVPQENPFAYFTSTHASPNIQDYSNFAAQLQAGTLPPVVFVQPAPPNNMHPAPIRDSDTVNNAMDWLEAFIQQVQSSSIGAQSAIVLIWDEAGGWWDHVPPPQVDTQGLGIRVPMLVISPLAKKGYISHVQMDHVSLLKFIQWNWGLAPLNARNQLGNDLRDMFQP